MFSDVADRHQRDQDGRPHPRAGDRPSVNFTFTVTNDLNEPATITSLADSVYGPLTGDADCQVGTVLLAFAQLRLHDHPHRQR